MRIEQPQGERGSLKWIQRAVNERWPSLNDPLVVRRPPLNRVARPPSMEKYRVQIRADAWAAAPRLPRTGGQTKQPGSEKTKFYATGAHSVSALHD